MAFLRAILADQKRASKVLLTGLLLCGLIISFWPVVFMALATMSAYAVCRSFYARIQLAAQTVSPGRLARWFFAIERIVCWAGRQLFEPPQSRPNSSTGAIAADEIIDRRPK
jgi:sugar phosphate permease